MTSTEGSGRADVMKHAKKLWRARAARQEMMVAEQELETAKNLLETWNSAEGDALEENARLQSMVVEAQAAVRSFRAGKPIEPAGAGTEPVLPASRDGHSLEAGSAATAASGNGGAWNADGQDTIKANGVEDPTEGRTKARCEETTESRKQEEADALASQLQIIAMHLEDEVQMMKELQGGEGAVGVVRRIRTLREETSTIQEDTRKTYSMARYTEARVIVLSNRGDELRSQLLKLSSYMSRPPVKPVGVTLEDGGDDDSGSWGAGKEDMDPRSPGVADEYHGPELDAVLGSEDEASPGQENRVAVDDGSGERSSNGTVSGPGDNVSASEQPATPRESVLSEIATGEVMRAAEPVVGDAASSHSMEPTAGLGDDAEPVERQAAGGSDGGFSSGKGRQGQRRHEPRKNEPRVSVMQEVLSSVFGWDMSASKKREARRQGPEAAGVAPGGAKAVLA